MWIGYNGAFTHTRRCVGCDGMDCAGNSMCESLHWSTRVPALIGWGKGGNVTSAGWQVILCDPIWHVSSRSGVVLVAQTAIRFLTLLYLTCRSVSLTKIWSELIQQPMPPRSCRVRMHMSHAYCVRKRRYPQNGKYAIYRNATRGGPSHSRNQHEQEI